MGSYRELLVVGTVLRHFLQLNRRVLADNFLHAERHKQIERLQLLPDQTLLSEVPDNTHRVSVSVSVSVC